MTKIEEARDLEQHQSSGGTMKPQSETISQAMNYATAMEECAAYISVNNPRLSNPEDTVAFLRPIMDAATNDNSQEAFFCLLMNTKNQPIGIPRECTRGLLDSCPVSPRAVFTAAIRESAKSILIAHNHPSGDPTPSKEDLDITKRLIEAGQILGIQILDHIIIGRNYPGSKGYYSMLEKKLVNFQPAKG